MKKVLITGSNSYIGTSFENWVTKNSKVYEVETVDTKNNLWRNKSFSGYDVVLHVAGIAHMKETKENEILYYQVNRDMAYEIAKKAKNEGVIQFIFLSTMSVYGMETGIIDQHTLLQPKSAYGKSKLEAEQLIKQLENHNFSVAILRPPMVYGKGCKGNYSRLAKFALKFPVFPNVNNKRSMIYIDNLSEFIKLIIERRDGGFFFPQNKEYVNTSEMVNRIAKTHNKKILMVKGFNFLLKNMNLGITNKVFGDLIYKRPISEYSPEYRIYGLNESIELTEQ